MVHILKATSKGQVTLPAAWRKNFDSDHFLAKEKNGALVISPVDVGVLEEEGKWETIFDADRDNKGKGVPLDDFISALESTL